LTHRANSKWGAVLALCFLATLPGRAGVILTIQSAAANQNSTGNSFDVTLANTGPSSVSIDAFSFGIQTANADLSFTDATTATAAPYIFGVDTLFGPDLTGATSGQSLSTSDVDSVSQVTLAGGSTVGLGHVLFSVAAGAVPGVFAVTFISPATSLSDAQENAVAIDALQNGTITIASTVPEPSLLLPLAAVLLIGFVTHQFRAPKRRSKL
jgi:hypothetical protein